MSDPRKTVCLFYVAARVFRRLHRRPTQRLRHGIPRHPSALELRGYRRKVSPSERGRFLEGVDLGHENLFRLGGHSDLATVVDPARKLCYPLPTDGLFVVHRAQVHTSTHFLHTCMHRYFFLCTFTFFFFSFSPLLFSPVKKTTHTTDILIY